MSIYRSQPRSPRSDVHHVAEHIAAPGREQGAVPAALAQDWSERRKAAPPDVLLATAVRWIADLPIEVQPAVLSEAFPRIVNALAALWPRPDELRSYLGELLVDTRGGRKGFPLQVLEELHRLRSYYSMLHPEHRAR